jgi:arsenate reductase
MDVVTLLWRRLLAEFLGSALLTLVVVGSGIAAQQLSPGDLGLELLENALVTGGGLFVLIVIFGPISGGHFNPVVSFVAASTGDLSWSEACFYLVVQVVGCVAGCALANAMYSVPMAFSTRPRASVGHFLAEVVATAGLVLAIFALKRNGNDKLIAIVVGTYIAAAYFFTSSTSFANPAITVGRMFTNTFAGIAPSSAPAFIGAEILGGFVGLIVLAALFPRVRKLA